MCLQAGDVSDFLAIYARMNIGFVNLCFQAGDMSDFLTIYARVSIGFVNLCVYRQGMYQIFLLFTLE